jgi:hypothetical protein
MKKVFFLLLSAAVMVSALGVQVNRAKADGYITYEGAQYVVGTGIVFTFSAEGFRNKDLKNATILVGSDFHDLYCWVRKAEGRILCVARGSLTEFAGQTGIIYLGGQIFYVLIPNKHGIPDQGDTSLTCEEGLVPGADVRVDFGEVIETFFVPGGTLAEVQSQAMNWFSEMDFEFTSGLYCGFVDVN